MVRVRFVERHAVVDAEMVQHARGRIDLGVGLRPASLVGVAQVLEQKGVIAWLDADNIVPAGVAQVIEVRRVCAEGVLDDDQGQVGMLAAEPPEPAAGGVAFAVVFVWPSWLMIGSGASGMTSLRSGCTSAAPSSWWE